MITLQKFHSRIEAEMVKTLLATENIPTVIRVGNETGKAPSLATAGEVDLLIQPTDLDRANDLLNAIPFPK